MKKIFHVVVLFLPLFNLTAQDVSKLNPSIAFVTSGGYWEEDDLSGVYRIVVVNQGWEHVSSKVYIQWIQEDTKNPKNTIKESLLITSVSGVNWSIGQPHLEISKSGTKCTLFGTNPYTLEESKWVVQLAGLGKYLLEN